MENLVTIVDKKTGQAVTRPRGNKKARRKAAQGLPDEGRTCAMIVGCEDHANIAPVLNALLHPGEDLGTWHPDIPNGLAPRDVFVFISHVNWLGKPANYQPLIDKVAPYGVRFVEGSWPTETEHRRFAQEHCLSKGYRSCLVVDTDEVWPPRLLAEHLNLAKGDAADRYYSHITTYYGDRHHVIFPPEPLKALTMINLKVAVHRQIRDYEGGRAMYLDECCSSVHHLSNSRSDDDLFRKFATFSHRHEILAAYIPNVWNKAKTDPLLVGLHPTLQMNFHHRERILSPQFLDGCWEEGEPHEDPEIPATLKDKRVSVVIPLFGGPEDIRRCLRPLVTLQEAADGLVYEIIVVDDKSPDDAPDVVEREFPTVRLIRKETNDGFPITCNQGYEASSGEIVVFLNSDAIVTRAGWIRLLESLMCKGSVGAAGPMTNKASYDQPVFPAYRLENVDLFAKDMAWRDTADRDVPMLVGFCLAVRRSVLEELEFPFDPIYSPGLFEDNDLCLRIQILGFKCRLSTRAYIHHTGSQSLGRMNTHPEIQLEIAKAKYHEKWAPWIRLGALSHLPGQLAEPIVIREERFPAKWREDIARMAKQARISLCLIVRNGSRSLRQALESVAPICFELIVLDTGSTDDSMEIAREMGAKVYQKDWVDFSDARNHIQQFATGRLILWIDDDDLVMESSYEPILQAVLAAPPDVLGFILPVRFNSPAGAHEVDGVQVDHVKIYRNVPGARWIYPLHENVLPSLRDLGGRVAFVRDGLVRHASYDNSVEGQARKRERDRGLLAKFHEQYPDHAFAHFCSGMTHFYNAGFEDWTHQEALRHLERCLEVSAPGDSTTRKAYVMLGQTHKALGNLDEAIRQFEAGLAAVGEDPELRFQLALALSESNRPEDALANYRLVSKQAPDDFSSLDIGILGPKLEHNVATILLSLGRHREAVEHLREAIKMGFSPSAHILAQDALDQGAYAMLAEALEAMARLEMCHEPWCAFRLKLAESRGEDPISAFATAVRERPTDIPPRLELARRLIAAGRPGEAITQLEYLSARGVVDGPALLHDIALKRGDPEGVLRYIRRAAELDPTNTDFARRVADAEAKLNPTAIAVAAAEEPGFELVSIIHGEDEAILSGDPGPVAGAIVSVATDPAVADTRNRGRRKPPVPVAGAVVTYVYAGAGASPAYVAEALRAGELTADGAAFPPPVAEGGTPPKAAAG